MIVAMLTDQKGQHVQQNHEGDRTWFAVGQGFEDNLLLKSFHQGVVSEGPFIAGRTADHFQAEVCSPGVANPSPRPNTVQLRKRDDSREELRHSWK
jgi:hypothetical protein